MPLSGKQPLSTSPSHREKPHLPLNRPPADCPAGYGPVCENTLRVQSCEIRQYPPRFGKVFFLFVRLGLGVLLRLELQPPQLVKSAYAGVSLGKPLAEGFEFGCLELRIRDQHQLGQQDIVHQRVVGLHLIEKGV